LLYYIYAECPKLSVAFFYSYTEGHYAEWHIVSVMAPVRHIQTSRTYLQGFLKGDCTIDLLFDWFGISCMTTDNFCFYLQNGQTGGQWYSGTSPFSIP
jgi:hypothetical protein